jgi:hypothetical protein
MLNRMSVRLIAAGLVLSALGMAQPSAYKAPEGPAPKTPWGKPDFNGVWARPYAPDVTKNGPGQVGAGELPYTEWGKKQWEEYKPEEGDYTGSCLPFGHARSIGSPDPMQIMQTPDNQMAFLFEQNSWFQVFPVDGRKHDDRVASWFGNSVGHWEGDTLVIETINFNGLTRLDTIGHPHSDKLKLTEKLTRTDAGHIAYEMIVDDPKTYTKPWTNKRTFTLRTDWTILEYSCEENNKSFLEGRIKMPKYDGK